MKASKLGLLSGALVLGLASCDLISPGPSGPTISSFTASPAVVAAGDTTTLSWSVESTATRLSISPGIGTVTGTNVVTPEISSTTTYTLTATDAEGGSSTRTTEVTVEDDGSSVPVPRPPVGGGDGPTGTFGVSTSASGPFENDSGEPIAENGDERVISVPAGGTFFAEVAYADSDGIADITLLLVNSTPADIGGPLSDTPQGGFTVGEPTGECDLASTPTTVTCVYPITVAAGTVDIEDLPESGDEFAYVFRVSVEDGAGNPSGRSTRGYVNID